MRQDSQIFSVSTDIRAPVLMVPLAKEALYKCHLLFRVVDGLPHCREVPAKSGKQESGFWQPLCSDIVAPWFWPECSPSVC